MPAKSTLASTKTRVLMSASAILLFENFPLGIFQLCHKLFFTQTMLFNFLSKLSRKFVENGQWSAIWLMVTGCIIAASIFMTQFYDHISIVAHEHRRKSQTRLDIFVQSNVPDFSFCQPTEKRFFNNQTNSSSAPLVASRPPSSSLTISPSPASRLRLWVRASGSRGRRFGKTRADTARGLKLNRPIF